MKRVLVTGGRDWADKACVFDALAEEYKPGMTVVQEEKALYYAQADAVIADLHAAGYAIVELPKPDEGRDDWLDGTVHVDGSYVRYEEGDDGIVTNFTPDEARNLAAALLAAAAKA